ncbi:hypothetical protein CYMTET_11378 [Cymbomonas tetramitiformis]|uniref:Uncharacterized protein n=1 Tax=Cymbomonas tetramitiformis TaxID=36881 RepID=A0AAE0GM88_9CHLO|nr:hypothetical protein CYMTET_11378 [Cymbomonas tetramitiformis]
MSTETPPVETKMSTETPPVETKTATKTPPVETKMSTETPPVEPLLLQMYEWPAGQSLLFFLSATWFIAKFLSFGPLVVCSFLWPILFVNEILTKKRTRISQILASRTYSTLLQKTTSFETCTVENAEWFNKVLALFWPGFISPMVSKIIENNVQYYLDVYRPAALNRLELDECRLGDKPPRVQGAKAYCLNVDSPSDVEFELDLDITTGMNPALEEGTGMVLSMGAKVGSSYVGLPVQVYGENLSILGKLRVRIGGIDNKKSPPVGRLRISFAEPPELNFTLRTVGKVEVMDLPGVKDWKNNVLGDIISGLMVEPNALDINLDEIMNAPPPEEKKTVRVDVKVVKAENLKAADSRSVTAIASGERGTSDPYVKLTVLDKTRQTEPIMKTLNPVWNDADFAFIFSEEEWAQEPSLTFAVKDYDRVGRNDPLGDATVLLDALEDGVSRVMWLHLENVSRGKLMVSMSISGKSDMPKKAISDAPMMLGSAPKAVTKRASKMEDVSDDIIQVTVNVLRAENLVAADNVGNPLVKASSDPYLNLNLGTQHRRTTIKKANLNPEWKEEFVFEVESLEWRHPGSMYRVLKLEMKDWDIVTSDDPLGNVDVALDAIEQECMGCAKTMWLPLRDVPHGRVEISIKIAECKRSAMNAAPEPTPMSAIPEVTMRRSTTSLDENSNPVDPSKEVVQQQKVNKSILSNFTPTDNHISGFLLKEPKFSLTTSVRRRFFVIKSNELVYFETEAMTKAKGSVALSISSTVSTWEGSQTGLGRYPFKLSTRGTDLKMGASTDAERTKWVTALRETIKEHSKAAESRTSDVSVRRDSGASQASVRRDSTASNVSARRDSGASNVPAKRESGFSEF